MYRVFCESFDNFKKTFDDNNYRLEVTKPIELIVDINKYIEEKNKNSIIYKQLCDLIDYMKKNTSRFPNLKAFIWTLSSRNLDSKKYGIAKKEDLEEQVKIINSFLKLAYWY